MCLGCNMKEQKTIYEKIKDKKGSEYVLNVVTEWYNVYQKESVESKWFKLIDKNKNIFLLEYGYPDDKIYNYQFIIRKNNSFYPYGEGNKENAFSYKKLWEIMKTKDKTCFDCGIAILTYMKKENIDIEIAYGLDSNKMEFLRKISEE